MVSPGRSAVFATQATLFVDRVDGDAGAFKLVCGLNSILCLNKSFDRRTEGIDPAKVESTFRVCPLQALEAPDGGNITRLLKPRGRMERPDRPVRRACDFF